MTNTDSIIYSRILKMSLKNYTNKPASLFFEKLGYTFEKAIPICKKPGFIHRVLFSFSDSLSVEIRVKDLGQKEKLNFSCKFDPKVFLSKNTEWICLKYAGECKKGCEKMDCE